MCLSKLFQNMDAWEYSDNRWILLLVALFWMLLVGGLAAEILFFMYVFQ